MLPNFQELKNIAKQLTGEICIVVYYKFCWNCIFCYYIVKKILDTVSASASDIAAQTKYLDRSTCKVKIYLFPIVVAGKAFTQSMYTL